MAVVREEELPPPRRLDGRPQARHRGLAEHLARLPPRVRVVRLREGLREARAVAEGALKVLQQLRHAPLRLPLVLQRAHRVAELAQEAHVRVAHHREGLRHEGCGGLVPSGARPDALPVGPALPRHALGERTEGRLHAPPLAREGPPSDGDAVLGARDVLHRRPARLRDVQEHRMRPPRLPLAERILAVGEAHDPRRLDVRGGYVLDGRRPAPLSLLLPLHLPLLLVRGRRGRRAALVRATDSHELRHPVPSAVRRRPLEEHERHEHRRGRDHHEQPRPERALFRRARRGQERLRRASARLLLPPPRRLLRLLRHPASLAPRAAPTPRVPLRHTFLPNGTGWGVRKICTLYSTARAAETCGQLATLAARGRTRELRGSRSRSAAPRGRWCAPRPPENVDKFRCSIRLSPTSSPTPSPSRLWTRLSMRGGGAGAREAAVAR